MDAESSFTISRLTALFVLGLCLALVIERILELMKTGIDVIDGRRNWCRFWDKRAEATRHYLERRLRIFEYVDKKEAAGLLRRFSDRLLNTQSAETGAVPVICGDLIRTLWVRIGTKVVGMALGIVFAYAFRLDFLSVWKHPESATLAFDPNTAWATGVLLGLGAGPVHKVITKLEVKREERLAAAKGGS
jgi:hypothetical protein